MHGLLFSHLSESLDLAVAYSLYDGITHLCAHPVRLILMEPGGSNHRVGDAAHALRLAAPNSPCLVYGTTSDDSFKLDALRAGAQEVVFIAGITPDTFQPAIECTLARSWQPLMGTTLSVAPKLIHDLNNAVTAINGVADILLAHFHANARHHVCVEHITKAGARAAALLRTVTLHTSHSSPLQHEYVQCTTSTG